MKRLGIIALAVALLVTLSQCKKEKSEASNNESVKVPITLNVTSGNGSRVDVNTENGKVSFENGDALYVASNGVYVGMLIYNGIRFSGEVTEPTEGQKLHFYFLGNVDTEETLSEGTSTGCSVVISDQTENLPVISYNTSRENYEVGRTDYNARLMNQCALVKFNVTTPSNSPICITGMKNKVIVDFANNTLTPSQDGEGVIMLSAGSGENVEKWAILLPQEALEEGEEGSAYSEDGNYIGTRPAITTIVENGYLTQGIGVEVNNAVASDIPIGAINGLFSVSATKQVYFSKGNLQYIGSASTPYWKFAEHQWDYFGTTTGQNSESQNVDRDLFGWGTSGFNHGANCYQPWSTSQNSNDYYVYDDYQCSLNDQSGQADWGYNSISNGGNTFNEWRTLTRTEWYYVINTRSTVSGIRYAKAMVNNVNGVIIVPDDWNNSTCILNNTNNNGAGFDSNCITAANWISIYEPNGAVFLPAAGRRYGVSLNDEGSWGNYWSASYYYMGRVFGVHFEDVGFTANYDNGRQYGFAVRLVQDY